MVEKGKAGVGGQKALEQPPIESSIIFLFIQLKKTFKKFFLRFHLFLDRGEVRELERKRSINVWLPLMCPLLEDLACNPGLCPDWESNW